LKLTLEQVTLAKPEAVCLLLFCLLVVELLSRRGIKLQHKDEFIFSVVNNMVNNTSCRQIFTMKLRGTLFIKQIVQSYRPTETVWCNRFTQQNPKPKLVSVFLNRLRPRSWLDKTCHSDSAFYRITSVLNCSEYGGTKSTSL